MQGCDASGAFMSSATDPTTVTRPSRPLVLVGLIAIHIGIAGLLVVRSEQLFGSDGVARYAEISSRAGIPYRDFEVEFAPADVLVIEAAASLDIVTTYRRIVALMLVVDLACAATIAYGWGSRATAVYLLLTTPILLIIYLGTDLIWVMLATLAFALIDRGHERAGGSTLALAMLGKVWPIVLVPLLVVTRRRQALGAFSFVGLLGVALWVIVGGTDAPRQVLTFRGAHGWEFESLIGALVWIIGRRPTALDRGAPRVGAISPTDRVVLLGVVAAGLWFAGRRARTWKGDIAGVPALASVAILLCVSPVFSLEYAAWLIPWAAIAATEDPGATYALAVAAVEAATGLLAILYVGFAAESLSKVLLVLRNGLCLAISAAWLIGMPKRASRDLDPVQDGRSDRERRRTA
jgi:hypothetical protein